MGIPKFFRWTSERYPLISQIVEDGKAPEVDSLYLDLNGVIHNCTHPNDDDATFRLTEAAMFLSIFAYIEHLFTKIKPQKLFFIAVDGVAPRAKMNQQRSRRFRTAKEAKELREKAERRGEEMPEEEAFDSNCITPGTPFMARLSLQLKYFLAKKVTEDAAWRGVEIVLSGHEVPGEGEHKIMEYIRLAKAQPNYNSNTRHCMYGLDADLIMLGLLSHDPHFALLREEVTFGPRKKSKGGLETQNFYLLHLSLFREYLDLEFQDLRSILPFEYNLERIIDDFILLNIFVGNDFLPHLPGMHINEGALPLLFSIYKRVLPIAGGYLNEAGVLRVDRLQLILAELTKFEREQFEEEFADASWYRNKSGGGSGGKGGRHGKAHEKARAKNGFVLTQHQRALFDRVRAFILAQRADAGSPTELFLPANQPAKDKKFLSDLGSALNLGVSFNEYDPDADAPAIAISTDPLSISGDDDDAEALAESHAAIDRVLAKYDRARVANADGGDDSEEDEEEAHERFVTQKMDEWKRAYYKEKMGIDYDDKEQVRKLAYRYVEGLQWVLHYYYDGVASWGWFYDYHYAPKISDLLPVMDMKFEFNLGRPFRPFDQLMGVLPSLSSQHIPEAFRDLMTDPSSPIIDFYPSNFEADLNGKKQDWEAVVKIPFIDEKRLLDALDKREPRLTPDERARNRFGESWRLTYDAEKEHFLASSLPGVFPDIVHSRAKIEEFHLPTLDGLHLVKGLGEGAELGARALAGFPSVKTLPHYARIGHHGVNVFQSESRGESVIISIENTYEDVKTEQVAADRIGKRIFSNWPYLQEGLVVAVSDHLFKYTLGKVGGKTKVVSTPLDPNGVSKWRRSADRIEQHYSKRYGVLIGSIDILLHVRPLKGLKRLEDGSFVKEYEPAAEKEIELALQVAVPDVFSEDARYVEKPPLPIPLEFPDKSRVFFLGSHAYGTPAAVLGSTDHSMAIEVAFFPHQARENAELHKLVANRVKENYYPSYVIAKKVRLSSLALSKITSSMLLDHAGSRVNAGLNLKFEAKSNKVLGYSRKGANGWEFSDKALALVEEYKTAFPEIADALNNRPNEDIRTASAIFADKADARIKDLKAWIKEKGVRDLEAVPLFAEQLSRETVQSIEAFTSRLASNMANAAQTGAVKRVYIKGIPRTALLKPSHAPYRLRAQRFELGDRVVVVADTGNVPMSARGVVVGINSNSIEIVLDVPFLAGSTLGDRCSPYRGATVGFDTVLNLTQPQFVSANGANGQTALGSEIGVSALDRTLANGSSNGHGPANGSGRGGRGGASYRPPNMMRAAPNAGRPQQQQPGSVSIMQRPNARPPAQAVRSDVKFSGVAAGTARPSQPATGVTAGATQDINPLMAALGLTPPTQTQPGSNGAARPAPPPTAPRGPRAGGGGALRGGAHRGRGRGRGGAPHAV